MTEIRYVQPEDKENFEFDNDYIFIYGDQPWNGYLK